MPTGNQYGIDLGNILAQSSNIKSARLNREKNRLALDKAKAGIALREDELNKKSNLLSSKDAMTQQGIEGPEIKPLETLSQKEQNIFSAQAPEVAQGIAKTAKAEQQRVSLEKMYIARGDSEQDAKFKSNMDIKDVADFEVMYNKKDEIEQERVRNGVAQQGKFIQGVIETAQKDPQRANMMYQSFRTDSLKKVNALLKEGKTEEAEQVEASLSRSPESLISADGKFNANFLHLTLGKLNSILTTAESYEKEQVAETKAQTALTLEQEKQKKPSSANEKEIFQLMKKLDTEKDPQKRKWLNDRITKISQPDMTSLLINRNTVKNAQNNFALKVGLDDPYKLATVDTRTWTPEQQAEGNQVSSIIIKGLGANAKAAEKKMGEYGSLSEQMQNAITGYEDVGNFRAADETVKAYFSNYFGLSEKELESSEAAMAFQSMLNIKIKADSGSAVSGNEMVRNTLETASAYMSKDKILLGIKNVAKRQIGTLNALKKVMGPVAFNLKYGTVLSNYKDIASATDDKEVKKGDNLAALRAKKQTGGRQDAYNKILTQRPNATPAQINAYLDSKGL